MTPDNAYDAAKTGKKLLREARSGALATLIPGAGDPYSSLVNVATAFDGAPLLLLSRLALHTKNIAADPRVSLMLDERNAFQSLSGDPLEGARIMLMGTVSTTDDALARSRYLARHPDAYMFAGFGDFAFYRVEIAKTHLVAGFGRIDDLRPQDLLTDISDAVELAAAEAGAIAHMNDDHAAALRLYATKLLGAPEGAWRCVGCDPEGLDLQLERTGLRLSFPERVATPDALRQILVELAKQARAADT